MNRLIIVSLVISCLYSCNSGELPTVSTTQITSIKLHSAQCGGNITDDGGRKVTERGMCWSQFSNPTLSDSYTNDGYGLGMFTSSLTNLQSATTYFCRAYAINSVGIAYGNEINFTTLVDTFIYIIPNLEPPAYVYEIPEGSCGESVLWTICHYFGKNYTQKEINQIGGDPGRGLYGNELIAVLDTLDIPNNLLIKAETWESTVDMLNDVIISGNPIILGVKIYPDRHPSWYVDHFILVWGTNKYSKYFYYNSFTSTSTVTYEKLSNTEAGYSLVNSYEKLYAVEIVLP